MTPESLSHLHNERPFIFLSDMCCQRQHMDDDDYLSIIIRFLQLP